MQAEQAVFLSKILLDQVKNESRTTKKVVEAVLNDKRDYRPDPKARTAMDLAWHLVSSEAWFLEGLLKGEYATEEQKMPGDIRGIPDVVAWYERTLPGLLQQTEKLSGEHLAKPINFYGVFNLPAVSYLSFLLAHSVHHRGQLSTYLRPMGSKVPSIYGGSADEPFQMGAQA